MNQINNRREQLSKLREQIDELDGELLDLLARRILVVEQIAEHKQALGLPIRDVKREREILDRCGDQAKKIGLSTGALESIFRLILMSAREYQAGQKQRVPKNVDSKRVALIGGTGEMGAALKRIFEDQGHLVEIASRRTQRTPRDAAREADVVVISVPISVTEQVIRELGPLVRPEALLMDVTSVKQQPVRAMLESTSASVLGTHPMFGPGVHSFLGQRVVICDGRGEEWKQWVIDVFTKTGFVITESDTEKHDRAMAIVQVLTHFQTQVMGLALCRMKTPLDESLRFTSPAYLMELYVTARHFTQAPELYGPIEMLNPLTSTVGQTFCSAASDLHEILLSRDQERFKAVFEEVRAFFGEFADEAKEQSGFLIDRLVERSLGTLGS